MAEAAKKALEMDSSRRWPTHVTNGEQVAHCEAAGMVLYVPVVPVRNAVPDLL
jgi:hypothetical protein